MKLFLFSWVKKGETFNRRKEDRSQERKEKLWLYCQTEQVRLRFNGEKVEFRRIFALKLLPHINFLTLGKSNYITEPLSFNLNNGMRTMASSLGYFVF